MLLINFYAVRGRRCFFFRVFRAVLTSGATQIVSLPEPLVLDGHVLSRPPLPPIDGDDSGDPSFCMKGCLDTPPSDSLGEETYQGEE